MLFLSTKEDGQDAGNDSYAKYILPAWNAFSAQATAQGLNPVNGIGALSSSSPLPITGSTKLIVVESVFAAINSDRMAELVTVLKTRPDIEVVAFLDGCSSCSLASNLDAFVTGGVNIVQPESWVTQAGGLVGVAPNLNVSYKAPLNTASLYQSTFANAGLTTIVGVAYSPITNVPTGYALYTPAALSDSPPATTSAVALFVPQAASNSGSGACLFLMADTDPFVASETPAGQATAIATAFTDAALDPSGACAAAATGAPDLYPVFSGLDDGLTVNTAASVTLTIANADAPAVASTDGAVTVTLPEDHSIQLVPGSLNAPSSYGCTANGTEGFTCTTLPGIAAGDTTSTQIQFQIIAPNPIPSTTPVSLSAVVSGVTGEINTANNTATLQVSAPGYPDLTSTLSGPDGLTVGKPADYVLTVTNQGNLASTDGEVTIDLPAGVTVDELSIPDYCQITGTQIVCKPLPEIGFKAPANTLSIPFRITPTQPLNGSITATLTGVEGEQVTGNDDPVPLTLAAVVPTATPVPTLNQWALALLGLLVAGCAVAGTRRNRARH